ncbi:MAG: hypothetical protein K2X38_03160 [Gemmataceae bacterium]|nr:hypothetical protein [Gemmataceae bacterium]
MRWTIPLFVVGAVVLSGCGRPELREFSAPQDKFKMLFPGTPTNKKQNSPGGVVNSYTTEFRQGAYSVNSIRMPPIPGVPVKELLKLSSEEGMKALKGTITATKDVKSGNADGLEITGNGSLEGKSVSLRMRTYFSGDRLFQVIAMGKDAGFVNTDEANKVFDSFQILP